MKIQWGLASVVLAMATASVATQSGLAATIDNCNAIRAIPCYTVDITVPGSLGNMAGDSEPSPVSKNLTGLDDCGIGSGSGFAVAGFGRVGAKSEATNTSPIPRTGRPSKHFGERHLL